MVNLGVRWKLHLLWGNIELPLPCSCTHTVIWQTMAMHPVNYQSQEWHLQDICSLFSSLQTLSSTRSWSSPSFVHSSFSLPITGNNLRLEAFVLAKPLKITLGNFMLLLLSSVPVTACVIQIPEPLICSISTNYSSTKIKMRDIRSN